MFEVGEVPQTRAQLAAHLEAVGVRSGVYHLYGARLDDAFVMDHRAEGWVVFHSERGRESSLRTHAHEADGCVDLLARVTDDEEAFFDLVAGPAPTDEADRLFDAWLARRGVTRNDLSSRDWQYDDVPWVDGPHWRRYFVRIATARQLPETH